MRATSHQQSLPSALRVAWLTLTGLAWLLVLYFASHVSEQPALLGRYSLRYLVFLSGLLVFAIGLTVCNRQSILGAIYRRRYIAALVFGSLVVAFSAMEAFVRLADPAGIAVYEETNRYNLEMIADSALIYRHRPSWQTTYQGVRVQFNELGLREEPVRPKVDGEYRILFLGDYAVLGWGVPEEIIFTNRLQRSFASSLDQPVRLINAAVGGYNTFQQRAYLSTQGFSSKPDLVLLMYDVNDIELHKTPFDPWAEESFKHQSPPNTVRVLLSRSWLFRLAYHYTWLAPASNQHQNFFQKTTGWTVSMSALSDIIRMCEMRGVPVGVFFFRWQPKPLDTALLADVRAVAQPIPVEDVSTWFAGTDVRAYFNSTIDSHPNAEGHRVMAANIERYLVANHLVPEPKNPGSENR